MLLVLAVCLPLRFAQAAQNWCPWMQASMDQTAMAADMADCEGMSQVDGQCNLKVICTAVPLLAEIDTYGLFPRASHCYEKLSVALHPLWHAPAQRVPIFLV
jgi:hypothetical protein